MPYVCCCTAYTEPVFEEQALKAGMDKFLPKPIQIKQIEEILKTVKLLK